MNEQRKAIDSIREAKSQREAIVSVSVCVCVRRAFCLVELCVQPTNPHLCESRSEKHK